MTSKKLLLELLKRQKMEAWRSNNWDKLEPEITVDKRGGMDITLNEVCIGFSFDRNGRFLGIYNWQE